MSFLPCSMQSSRACAGSLSGSVAGRGPVSAPLSSKLIAVFIFFSFLSLQTGGVRGTASPARRLIPRNREEALGTATKEGQNEGLPRRWSKSASACDAHGGELEAHLFFLLLFSFYVFLCISFRCARSRLHVRRVQTRPATLAPFLMRRGVAPARRRLARLYQPRRSPRSPPRPPSSPALRCSSQSQSRWADG